MAIVNPGSDAVQDTPYINWSKEIQQPAPNRATEIALKGFGEAGLGAVEGLNLAKERGLQNDIYTQTEGMQDQFIAQLEKDRSLLQDQKQENQPASVKGLSGTLDTLNSAKQNGKLSLTDYNGRIDALAKQMRAENPGYRAYIDEQFERATGRTAANKYIAGLVSDINSYGEQKDALGKSVLSKLMSEEALKYPGAAAYAQMVQKDPSKAPMALEWLNKMVSSEHSDLLAREKARFADEQGDHARKDEKLNGQEEANSGAVGYVSSQLDFLMDHSGLSDSRNLQSFLNAARRGDATSTYTPEQQAQVKAFLDTNRARILSELTRRFTGPYSPKEAAEQAESLVKTQYDSVSEAIAEGRWNMANSNNHIIDAQTKQKIMTDTQLNSTLSMSRIIHKDYPEYSNQFAALNVSVPQKLQGLAAATSVNAATPGGNSPLADTIKRFGLQGVDPSKPEDAKLYLQTLKLFQTIGNKTTEPQAREALVDNLYSDKNKELLSMFDRDIPTGIRGRFIGRNTVYDMLLSRDNVDEVAKMSFEKHGKGEQDQHYWKNLRNMAETWLPYVMNRDDLVDMGEKHPALSNMAIHYDPKSGDFSMPTAFAKKSQFTSTKNEIDTLNRNIKTLRYVYQKQESDPDPKIYEILQAHSSDPNSIVGKMLQAMEAAYSDRQQ